MGVDEVQDYWDNNTEPQESDSCFDKLRKSSAILIAFILIWGVVSAPLAKAETGTSALIAKQFDDYSCLLGATATHLNYVENAPDYSAKSLALAYTAKYGTSDWYKDGNTAHNAQMLATYAVGGYQAEVGHLASAESLRQLVEAKRYPIIFLAGSQQHAIVAISINGDIVGYADPYTGSLVQMNLYSLFNYLEAEKWYFAVYR